MQFWQLKIFLHLSSFLNDFCDSGSLMTRSLADIVSKSDFVLDSEYLVTILVVVQK